ncbi:MAG: M23 family metallopeptidase [Bacillus sp. (in: firmicutes)]
MLDYGKRFLIVLIIALCIGLMFIGGTNSKAADLNENSVPNNWICPAEGIVSDYFGTRGGAHKGIDIAGYLRSEIIAVSDGVVSKSYYSDSYGHVVFIQHPNDGFETVYAHLDERLVNEGQAIKQGQVIGKMGNTGRSTGVHLHFEVHHHNWSVSKENAINPLLVIEEIEPDNRQVGRSISALPSRK